MWLSLNIAIMESGLMMKQYDVTCPFCGTVNHNLFLEETNGRMECEHCHRDVQTIGLIPAKRIPIYTPQQLVEYFNNMNTQIKQRLD